MSPRPPRVAVVGGGIAGLAAALRLRERLGPAAEIVVYEQQSALGGKLRTGALAGRPMVGLVAIGAHPCPNPFARASNRSS